LPRSSIKRTKILGKIIFKKYPTLTRFRARELTHASAPANLLRMHLQESSGFRQN